ncbi:bone morphogenetic protein 2-like isoform X2 [Biomphalaria glabrata]|uniref:Bone morphogenetic protein 2-like isoform X2 n=1 Tax=Biomphalaria glabrata TaxID=6526 RepID=A0A9W2ZTJ2_BIOGL|nr:bone morphogenetic protein 2-like isoform X2 [Biomphalaria glabrata]XP_055878310.1 bone morphogenetic protein 2-like isoform X2 [Biomphalaria glabrata]XP_055878311.1 bone morphogenetic protein 2-like isoform X2 [Biomphalaria glabrata]
MVLIQPHSVSLGNTCRSAQVSMTGVSYGNYRIVLLVLMVLNYTLTTLHASDSQNSSASSTLSSSIPPRLTSATRPPQNHTTSSLLGPTSPAKEPPPANSNSNTKPTKLAELSLTDKDTLGKLEKIFLKRAGLQKKPTIRPEFAVPEYMLDLYRTQATTGYLQVKGNGPLSANTVRSFVHNDEENGRCKPPLCAHISFDVKSIPENEILTGAELRLYINTGSSFNDPLLDAAAGRLVTREKHHSDNATVHRCEIHQILRPETPDSEAITRLLDTHVIDLTKSRWQTFDILPAILKWKNGVNHGLEVRLRSRAPVLTTEHHVRVRRAASLQDLEWAITRPVLVTYTHDKSSAPSTSTPSPKKTKLRRNKRNASGGASKKDNGRKNNKKRGKKKRKKVKGKKNICKRHSLYVNFDEVGWNDWIVAPNGYNAYFCHGECMAPLPDFAKATNHAMLQARVYKVNPNSVPMVCCVPIKMSPMSMLYRDEQGKTILKVYQDMSVDECGCK